MQASSPETQEALRFLEHLPGSASVNFGQFLIHKHRLPAGTLRIVAEQGNSLNIKAYDREGSRLLYVAAPPTEQERIRQAIDGYNRTRTTRQREETDSRPIRDWRKPLTATVKEHVAPPATPETPNPQEPKPMAQPAMLTVQQAAERLGVSPASITLYIRDGKMKAFRVDEKVIDGRTFRNTWEIPEPVVQALAIKRRQDGKTPRKRANLKKKGRTGLEALTDAVNKANGYGDGQEPPLPALPLTSPQEPRQDTQLPAKVLTADSAEWLLMEQAAQLVGLSTQAINDYIISGALTVLPGSPVVLVRRLDAELLKKKLAAPENGQEAGPLAPIIDRLTWAVAALNDSVKDMKGELHSNSMEIKALRELLPGFLETPRAAGYETP